MKGRAGRRLQVPNLAPARFAPQDDAIRPDTFLTLATEERTRTPHHQPNPSTMLRTLTLALALCAACSSVRTPVPLGDPVEDLQAQEWAGRYFAADAEFVVEVDYGLPDELWIQFFEHKREDGTWSSDDRAPVLMRALSPPDFDTDEALLLLAHFPEEQGTRDGPFDLVLIQKLTGQLVAWTPNVEYVAGLVEEEVLPGEVVREGETTRVTLGELSREEVAAHVESDLRAFFDLTNPVALVRLPDTLIRTEELTALREAGAAAVAEDE